MFIERSRRRSTADREWEEGIRSLYAIHPKNQNEMFQRQHHQQQQPPPRHEQHTSIQYNRLLGNFIIVAFIFSKNTNNINNKYDVVQAFTTPFGIQQQKQQRHGKYEFLFRKRPFGRNKLSLSTSTVITSLVDHAEKSIQPTNSTTSTNSNSNSNNWFPTRIQESIDYDIAVERLYVRHIVTQTKEMANIVVQQYLSNNEMLLTNNTNNTTITTTVTNKNNDDKFGRIAKLISDCIYTRTDGGKIGWIERHDELQNIISNNVIQQLYSLKPKSGDIYIITDENNNNNFTTTKGQYHVLQVTEVWLNTDYVLLGNTGNIRRKRNKKFKGQGVVPQVPTSFRTYSIQTSGCQMNVADSERLEGILQKELNLQPLTTNDHNSDYCDDDNKKSSSKDNKNADLIIFNTCSIRDHAEQKLYNAIGPYAAQRRNGKQQQQQSTLIVTGCVAQQEGEKLIQRIPEIDAVIGPQYIPYLSNIMEHIQTGGNQLVLTAPLLIQQENYNVYGTNTNTMDTTIDVVDNALYTKPVRGHDVRAWVNVIHGCNEHCTYCVVPATRGMEQSRSMESILDECQQLAVEGYKEITLLGQNIDAYGRDMVPKRTFAQLLHYLNTNLVDSSIERIRYVTSHPRYFSDRVIEAVANLDKVCECFHMPFQAGDDTVLRRMRRGYTYESYYKIIERIRDIASDDAAITTDIIVGFPGETEEQFQRTLDLMEAVKFDNVNSFIYSPRPNTEAATYDDTIPYEIKAQRLQRVQQLAVRHGQERSNRYLNRVVEVLVEDTNPKIPTTQVMGRTRQGRQVYFDGNLSELKGQLVQVQITEARTWSLLGKLVTTE